MILSHASYPVDLVWWFWWKSQGVKGRRMEVEVWENARNGSIVLRKRNSLFIWPFSWSVYLRLCFLPFSPYHMITFLLLHWGHKTVKILASASEITFSVGLWPPKSIRCPEEWTSQKFTEIWHLKWWKSSESFTIWGLKFCWTIGDLCCRSKEASQLSRIPMAPITSCFQSADSPVEVFSFIFSAPTRMILRLLSNRVAPSPAVFMEFQVRWAHQFDNCNEHLHVNTTPVVEKTWHSQNSTIPTEK